LIVHAALPAECSLLPQNRHYLRFDQRPSKSEWSGGPHRLMATL
jgi:hypothetical protein